MTKYQPAIVAALLSLAAVTTALADDQAQPVAPPAVVAPMAPPVATVKPAKPNPDDKVICKHEVPTGSRLGGKTTCMKRRDWDAISAQARDDEAHANPH